MPPGDAIDVHQHLWPEALVDRLRARSKPPFLRGWTLVTAGEQPFDVDPRSHDVAERGALDHAAGVGLACVSLSAPLGLEQLPRPEAGLLLDAWHSGAAALPDHFRAWASVPVHEPDLGALRDLLRSGFVGVQLPAMSLATPAAWERAGDLLRVAEQEGRPVLVHPGPVLADALAGRLPRWWAPVVGYVAQLQAAWWAWHALGGRSAFPTLRVVFAAAAGLAPVHQERLEARGGDGGRVDPDVFVDTSSYGVQALDAVVRAIGVDALVLGSDAPYASPLGEYGGDAALHAIRVSNPRRALGDLTTPSAGEASWRRAG